MKFYFLNLYGPYVDREVYWSHLVSLDCFKSSSLIMGGDLNFSMGYSEIWGTKARVDPLSDFFNRQLDGLGLVDIAPVVFLPTWSNRRIGIENISKRLDRLLISADLLDCDFHFRQWVGCGGVLDHHPVFLQVANNDTRPHSPFKFNANWLENGDLVTLLKASWKAFDVSSGLSSDTQFAANLKTIKEVSISWSIKKKVQDNKNLVDKEALLVASFNS